MLANLKTRCPHCQTNVRVGEEQVHQRVSCPSCQQPFEVSSVEIDLSGASDQPALAAETLAANAAGTSTDSDSAQPAVSDRTTHRYAVKDRSAQKLAGLGRIGRFELREVLGQGAYGRVYRAYDPQLDREVALKVPTFGPEEKHKIQRFVAEAKAAARLRHPNIVPTYESGLADGHYYIASQFVTGRTLSKVIDEGLPEFRQSAEWVRQLADALAYAHNEGIVHRDIKPGNVMIDSKGIPQIMDFGLAKRLNDDAAMTTDGAILGTPAYMSPEQARGDLAAVGPASDQYSLGAVLYELLVGRKPFDGLPHAVVAQVIAQEPPAPSSLRPGIPRDLEAICLRAMTKESRFRYASATSLAEDLARWLRGDATSARPVRAWERTWKWARRNPVVAGLTTGIVLVLMLGLAGISWALRSALVARNAAQTALSDVERQQTRLAGMTSELQSTVNQLQESNAQTEAQRLRAEEERKQKEVTGQQLEKTNENLERKVTEAEEATRAAELAKQEEARQTELAKKSAAEEAEARRTSAALARATSMKLVLNHWIQANTLLDDGNYPGGINYLARALKELPNTDQEDSRAWNEVLRMAIAVELAGQPGILSRDDRKRDIVGFWDLDPQPPPELGSPRVPVRKPVDPSAPPLPPRLIDAAGNVDGETQRLELEDAPTACVRLPTGLYGICDYWQPPANSLQYSVPKQEYQPPKVLGTPSLFVVTAKGTARLLQTSPAAPKGEWRFRSTPFASQNTVVRAMARHSLPASPSLPDGSYDKRVPFRHIEFLITVMDTSGRSSVRIDRWDPKLTKVIQLPNSVTSVRAVSEFEHAVNILPLPDPVDHATPGLVMHHVVTSGHGRICIWDVQAETLLAQVPQPEPVVKLLIWPARRAVFVVGKTTVQTLSYPQLRPLDRYEHDAEMVNATATPTGQSLVIVDVRGRLVTLDSASLRKLAQPSALPATVSALAFRKRGELAVIGGRIFRQWELPLGQELVQWRNDDQPMLAERAPILAQRAAVASSGDWAIVAHDKHVASWSPSHLADPAVLAGIKSPAGATDFDLPLAVSSIACHPAERRFAATANNGIYLYDSKRLVAVGDRWQQDGLPMRDAGEARFTALSFAPREPMLASGDVLGIVRLWNWKTHRDVWQAEAESSAITALAYSANGNWLAAAAGNRARVYDVQSRQPLSQRCSVATPITALALSSDGQRLLIGSEDGLTQLFETTTAASVGQPVRHAKAVRAAEFLDSGDFALAVGGGGMQVIHVATGMPAGRLMRDVADTSSAAIAAGGTRALLAGRIYDLPKPIAGSADEVLVAVEQRVGSRLDKDGNLAWLEDR